MDFTLKAYNDIKVNFHLDNLMGITGIVYLMVTGDEVVHVFYDDGTDEVFDSAASRLVDYLDEIKLITLDELKNLNNDL